MQRKKITPFHVMNSLLLGLLAILCLLPSHMSLHCLFLTAAKSSPATWRCCHAALHWMRTAM